MHRRSAELPETSGLYSSDGIPGGKQAAGGGAETPPVGGGHQDAPACGPSLSEPWRPSYGAVPSHTHTSDQKAPRDPSGEE